MTEAKKAFGIKHVEELDNAMGIEYSLFIIDKEINSITQFLNDAQLMKAEKSLKIINEELTKLNKEITK